MKKKLKVTRIVIVKIYIDPNTELHIPNLKLIDSTKCKTTSYCRHNNKMCLPDHHHPNQYNF